MPIYRHRSTELNPVQAAFIEAACAYGLAYVADHNRPGARGHGADALQCRRRCPDEHRADLPWRRPRPPQRRVDAAPANRMAISTGPGRTGSTGRSDATLLAGYLGWRLLLMWPSAASTIVGCAGMTGLLTLASSA